MSGRSRPVGGPAISDWDDAGAAYWQSVYADQGIDGAVYRLRLRRVIAAVAASAPAPPARILELGPGAGLVTAELARRGHRVVCVDPAPRMLENTLAHARAQGVGERVETVVADAHALPFPDAGFAAVVAVGVLPWLAEPLVALREIRRVLVAGGTAVLTSDNRARLSFLLDPRLNPTAVEAAKRVDGMLVRRLGTHSHRRAESLPRRYRNAAVDRMLTEAGLVKVAGTSVGFGPFSVLQRPLLPAGPAIGVHERLQRMADAGVPGLRGTGAHYVVVARSPAA